MKKYLILLALAGFIICLDQATKLYIHTQFQYGESVSVINGFFNITYVRNLGAAFGFLRDASPGMRSAFFLSVPPLASIIILFMLRATPKEDTVVVMALSAIFGGALGNYIDRLWHGFVVDFLDFHWYQAYSYPAFNVADISIVTGIALMVLIELRKMMVQRSNKLA